MTDEGQPRSIRMPPEVWRALDEDARRCRRSATKQIEAILTVYYGLDDVELMDLAATRERVSPTLEAPVKRIPTNEKDKAPGTQNYLFSAGSEKPLGKKLPRAVRKDIEDIKRDAAERTKRKKSGQK